VEFYRGNLGCPVVCFFWHCRLFFLALDTCFFLKFGKVLVIISSNIFSIHFSPSSFAIPIMQMLAQLISSQRSHMLHYLKKFFLFALMIR
jgi:hypothetical protein